MKQNLIFNALCKNQKYILLEKLVWVKIICQL